jgi:hypothetical protein
MLLLSFLIEPSETTPTVSSATFTPNNPTDSYSSGYGDTTDSYSDLESQPDTTDSYSGYSDLESQLDTTDSYSGYGDTTDAYSGYGPDTTNPNTPRGTDPPPATDAERAGTVVTPRNCVEGSAGCSELATDTEGLIDDEDYVATTKPTNHNTGSGEEVTVEPGTGSGNGREKRRSRRRSKRNRVGVNNRGPHPMNSPNAADFQSMVREIVEQKKEFAMRFSNSKRVVRATRRGTVTVTSSLKQLQGRKMEQQHGKHIPYSLTSDKMERGSNIHSRIHHHGDGVQRVQLQDMVMEEEQDPAVVYLHTQETETHVSSDYLHHA